MNLYSNWLVLSAKKKGYFCLPCATMYNGEGAKDRDGKIIFGALIKSPLTNFNSLTGSKGVLVLHSNSNHHKFAITAFKNLSSGVSITSYSKSKQNINKEALRRLIYLTYVMARSGIPFRGHDDSGRVDIIGEKLSGCRQGNFKNLLSLLARYVETMHNFIQSSSIAAQYTSWSIQNEIISIISESIISENLKIINNSTCWGFSFDETPDKAKKEQISLVIRHMTSNYENREVFFGFYDAYSMTNSHSLNAKALSEIIIQILVKSGLNTSKLVSVSTDGANIMSGKDAGCVTFLRKKFPKLLYTVCLSHSMNLCVSSSMDTPTVANIFHKIEKIISFFKWPKRNNEFKNEQKKLVIYHKKFQKYLYFKKRIRQKVLSSSLILLPPDKSKD